MTKRGETRDVILDAAARLFFQNGFEKTSVKMILEEAHVVTGSFYHFFPSKEALFEAAVERFLEDYTRRVGEILDDETLGLEQIAERILGELRNASERYFDTVRADNLHWTVQCALHEKTLASMAAPMARALARLRADGAVVSYLHVDDATLARILIRGSEAVLYGRTGGVGRFEFEKARADLMEFWKRILAF